MRWYATYKDGLALSFCFSFGLRILEYASQCTKTRKTPPARPLRCHLTSVLHHQ
jgi:hypothetical protein